MGNHCSSNLKQQYQLVRTFQHPTLGELKLIRNTKIQNSNISSLTHPGISENNIRANMISQNNGHSLTHQICQDANIAGSDANGGNAFSQYSQKRLMVEEKDGELIAMKHLRFGTQKELNQYIVFVKESNLYYNIPTLLKIMSYEVTKGKNSDQSRSYRCDSSYGINIYFRYYSHTLQDILTTKRKQLLQYTPNPHSNHSPHQHHSPTILPKSIKLNNYRQIDCLPASQRKLCNIYYQQVQILRMIDHIVGALYFLNHLEHKHEAVSPANVMIDEEGKFVLLDAIVLGLGTNYGEAFGAVYGSGQGGKYVHDRNGRINTKSLAQLSSVKYLAPQLLGHIKNGDRQHRQNSQKAQVFSVGLIALDMCLLQYNILQQNNYNSTNSSTSFQLYPTNFHIVDRANLKINKTELTKALIQAQSRYSVELVDLLSCMLEYDPQKRINFSLLIDMLSPLLSDNLAQIQRLYSHTEPMSNNIDGNSEYRHRNNNNNNYINIQDYNKSYQQYQSGGNMNISHGNKNSNDYRTDNRTNPNHMKQSNSTTFNLPSDLYSHQLIHKLSQLETNFQKILNRAVMYDHVIAELPQSHRTRPKNASNSNNPYNAAVRNVSLRGSVHQVERTDSSDGNNDINAGNVFVVGGRAKYLGINDRVIIEEEKRILGELRKINIVGKSSIRPNPIPTPQPAQHHPTHKSPNPTLTLNQTHKLSRNPRNTPTPTNSCELDHRRGADKREVKGSELYDLYLSQYETIKKNRFR